MAVNAILKIPVTTITKGESEEHTDAIAIEEPLEIRLAHGPGVARKVQNISVTMRTPGNDAELACGFLFTEGVIKNVSDIKNAEHCFIACAENRENVIQVSLAENVVPNLQNTERNFYTTSSCGVCGKGSINAIRTISNYAAYDLETDAIIADVLTSLPAKLHQQQKVFADTGGLHASALFNLDGELLLVREDVGRHNALDKLIGATLLQNLLPLNNCILLLSGRASFELVQKAAMAGIHIIAAVGAPSSLAVQLAKEFNITLAGFLRGQRFNIYTVPRRILAITNREHENSY
ncbi:formate dehydrogenase accessory sulfurtransferase FdhD [Mucilaginibacter gilvus]|uniref:Sulfur carrier protein FdhD n=1 Tax=Mucilaginibacter gilvus TaxID=2305909 RepID=A0A3S3VKN5_9SPHI|nr:formate dehydrogenase accessory sulfurtransferase FdhD [Mucilaginibacter gilvus]RWY50339.1 formate dehydrogenase accessory sulfurtransferase FdhD [Mucilaginibacter gilvus]